MLKTDTQRERQTGSPVLKNIPNAFNNLDLKNPKQLACFCDGEEGWGGEGAFGRTFYKVFWAL